ncbi:MAG: hypothetical protein EXQ77_02685 [Thermoleophilia bacterium]|nr:hypothetical protein [Thermoleophilia bacterium]
MPVVAVSALLLALAAAVLHAGWNLLLARERDVESATAVALVAAAVVFAPVAALDFEVERAALPYLLVTSIFQLLYFGLLATAYRTAELSFVYPISRGLAPVLVLIVGALALGQATTAAQAAGVVVIGAGVVLVRGLRGGGDARTLLLTLGIAGCIASYTLIDSYGIAYASPITYLELSMIPATLAYVAVMLRTRGAVRLRAAVRPLPVAAGLLSFGAYALVLAALERAPAASVAAVRETSVLIATALAAAVLGERVSRGRLAGAVLVAAGIAALALAR